MKRFALLGAILVATVAHADAPNAKSLWDAYAKASLVDDAGKSVEELRTPQALQAAQSDLMGPAKIKVGTTKSGTFGNCGWVTAETVVTAYTHPEQMGPKTPKFAPSRPWHWLGLVDKDGKFAAIAEHATQPDKELEYGIMNEIAGYKPDTSPVPAYVSWLASPKIAATHLAKDAVVFGTSATDKAYGAVAAKKLLAGWSKLSLDLINSGDLSGYGQVTSGDCVAASKQVRMKHKRGFILLDAFVIAHKVGDDWEIVALSYAANDVYH